MINAYRLYYFKLYITKCSNNESKIFSEYFPGADDVSLR